MTKAEASVSTASSRLSIDGSGVDLEIDVSCMPLLVCEGMAASASNLPGILIELQTRT